MAINSTHIVLPWLTMTGWVTNKEETGSLFLKQWRQGPCSSNFELDTLLASSGHLDSTRLHNANVILRPRLTFFHKKVKAEGSPRVLKPHASLKSEVALQTRL